jgi:DUF971 family protein
VVTEKSNPSTNNNRYQTTMLPVALKKTENRNLTIEWDDKTVQEIPFRVLRDACLCAVCNAKREKELKNPAPKSTLNILSAAEVAPLDIVKMHPVGNYAYNIHFSDGHSTGIYTFEMLRGIGAIKN